MNVSARRMPRPSEVVNVQSSMIHASVAMTSS